jgi:monoamine oxidase
MPDLGGAQIGRDYARVLDMATRLKVQLGPGAHINAPYAFVVNDTLIPAREWQNSPLNKLVGPERAIPPHALGGYYVEGRTPFTTLEGWLGDDARAYDVSLADWLTRQGASVEARRIIRESQGRPLEDLSVLRMMQEATRGKIGVSRTDPETLKGKDAYERAALLSQHVVGGTSRLTDAMTAALGDRIQMRRRVTDIDLGRRQSVLTCADGSRVRARFVIVAVPFTVLREIAISPALRGDQADAVRRMPYGNQSQVWLRTREPYWEKDGIEASMWTDGAFNLIRQQIESDGHRELISVLAFSEKSVRLDAMPLEERGRFAIAEIERIRPATRGLLEFVGAHSWQQAPYERGCSFQMVPGKALDWARAMAKPHGRLHFAGEHLRQLEVGMEAAMESGERAAREVAEQLA